MLHHFLHISYIFTGNSCDQPVSIHVNGLLCDQWELLFQHEATDAKIALVPLFSLGLYIYYVTAKLAIFDPPPPM